MPRKLNIIWRLVCGKLVTMVAASRRPSDFSANSAFGVYRYVICAVLGILTFGFVHYIDLYASWELDEYPEDFELERLNVSSEPEVPTGGPGDHKIILLWNPFFGEADYGAGGFGSRSFNKSNCSNTCWITNDHAYLPNASAVVLHAFNMGPRGQNITLPTRANQQQIFVFFILESPLRSYNFFLSSNQNLKDMFNLTFTFVNDPETDIYIPMGGYKPKPKPDDSQVLGVRKIKNKKYAVAWFVSNCNAPSARMEYVEELSKYIDVHVYGECGDFECKQGDYKCFARVMSEYLFYLSFENSFCEGYVTEKVFRTLKTHMVPIVYGFADYASLMRPKSYIDIRDFAYPKALAKYLLYLQRNPLEYQKYFAWKRDYSVLQEGDFKAQGFCRLCQILHTDNYPYKTNYDPLTYWNPDRWCLQGDEERRAVHLL